MNRTLDWAWVAWISLTVPVAACGDDSPADGSGPTGAASSAGDTGTPNFTSPFVCMNPTPIEQTGSTEPTGYETCEGGLVHRSAVVACDQSQIMGDCGSSEGSCSSDADCTDALYGTCNGEPIVQICSCSYGCASDSDCAADEACYCRGTGSRCVKAYCRSDADCGGYLCAFARDTLACHTPDDTCRVADDCAEASCPSCAYDPAASAWACDFEFDACDA